MFQIVLSAFIACASAIVATPYGLAAPVYHAPYAAPIATSYANTYKVASSYPAYGHQLAPIASAYHGPAYGAYGAYHFFKNYYQLKILIII